MTNKIIRPTDNLILSFTLLIYLNSSSIFAQNNKFDWAKNIHGSSKQEHVRCTTVCVDNSGNTYTSGNFIGTVDFDHGAGVFNMSSYGGVENAFICKFDQSGNFIWGKQLRSIPSNYTGSILPKSIKVNAKGEVILTGYFSGLIDFNPGIDSFLFDIAIGGDGFVIKLDDKGDFIWAKQLKNHPYAWSNQPSLCTPSSLGLDSLGNIIIGGDFFGKVDMNPGTDSFYLTSSFSYNNLNYDVFIAQLDSNGKFNWAKSIGTAKNNESARNLCVDRQGNTYAVGHFYDTLDFNPDTSVNNMISNGNSDVFVLKLDGKGKFKWSKIFGGIGGDQGWGIAVDSFGSIYTIGYYSDTVDFDPGNGVFKISSYLNSRSFVSKLDSNGIFLWAKSIKSYGNISTYITSFEINSKGDCYFMGNLGGKADLDPSSDTFEINKSGRWKNDKFICSWNKFGNLTWAKQMASNRLIDDGGIVINSNNLFFLSNYSDTLIFDPANIKLSTTTNKNTFSTFILKFSSCIPDTTFNNIVACNKFTWTDGKTYTTSNNTAFRKLINKNGCDSIVKLNLTILFPNENTMPRICAVTVDSSSGKNEVIWEKQGLDRASKYYIYRENPNSQLMKIGTVHKDSFSTFIDTGSYPLTQSNRYKLTIRDSCGYETPLDSSPAHKTVHLTSNVGVGGEVNLIWNKYEGKSYSAHNIMRSTNGGTYSKIAQVSSNVSSYSDLNPPSGTLSYVIYLSTTACNPKRSEYAEIKSNPVYIRPTSISSFILPSFLLTPNPTKNFIQVFSDEKISKIEIFDPTGKLVKSNLSYEMNSKIDVSTFNAGVYFVRVSFEERGSSTQKFTKE